MAIDPAALAQLMGGGASRMPQQSPFGAGTQNVGALLAPGLLGAGSNLARTGMALMQAGGPQQLPGSPMHPQMPMMGQRPPMAPPQVPGQPSPFAQGGGMPPGAPGGMPGQAQGNPMANPLVMALLRAKLAQGGGAGGGMGGLGL